jgi:hypothetical protein
MWYAALLRPGRDHRATRSQSYSAGHHLVYVCRQQSLTRTTLQRAVVRIRPGEYGLSCCHANVHALSDLLLTVTQQQTYTMMPIASLGATRQRLQARASLWVMAGTFPGPHCRLVLLRHHLQARETPQVRPCPEHHSVTRLTVARLKQESVARGYSLVCSAIRLCTCSLQQGESTYNCKTPGHCGAHYRTFGHLVISAISSDLAVLNLSTPGCTTPLKLRHDISVTCYTLSQLGCRITTCTPHQASVSWHASFCANNPTRWPGHSQSCHITP